MQHSLSAAENLSSEARTVVIACAEASDYDAACKSPLRDHALVLRSDGGVLSPAVRSALAGWLGARSIERVVLLGHPGCAARGAGEPMQNTAALAAWYRLAPAVRTLARERAAGLDDARWNARLDALVQLANLEGCAELHAALRRGELTAHAVVYEPRDGTLALFDGTRFNPVDAASFARLIAGQGTSDEGAREQDAQSGVHPLVAASTPRRAECALEGRC